MNKEVADLACINLSFVAGVLQGGHPVQARGAAGCPNQEKYYFVPGCLQRIPGQTGLQEEKGKSAVHLSGE